MKRKITILTLVIAIVLGTFLFFPPYTSAMDLNNLKVSSQVEATEDPDIYTVYIQVAKKDESDTLIDHNFILAYALDGEKYQILGGESERFFFQDKETLELSTGYYINGGSKHGSYVKVTKDITSMEHDRGAVLMRFKIKKLRDDTAAEKTGKVVVKVAPYKKTCKVIDITRENLVIETDETNFSKPLVYEFPIGAGAKK